MTLEGEQYVDSQCELLIQKLQKRWSFDTDDLECLQTLCHEFVCENAVGAVELYTDYVNNLSESEEPTDGSQDNGLQDNGSQDNGLQDNGSQDIPMAMEVDQKIKLKIRPKQKTDTNMIKNMFSKKTVNINV